MTEAEQAQIAAADRLAGEVHTLLRWVRQFGTGGLPGFVAAGIPDLERAFAAYLAARKGGGE